MTIETLVDLLLSTSRLAIPILFAAYGGLLSERSGIANISLESNLLFSAFAGAATTYATGNLWIGVASGVLTSGLVGALFASICIWGRGDHIVVGTGFNLLAVGLIPVICKSAFDITGSSPALPQELTFKQSSVFFVLGLVFLGLLEYLFRQTRHGLRITAAGENPAALATQGVNYRWVRLRAVVEGSFIAGIGGIYLSLAQGNQYVREMSAGRGFIALAALIFGAWRPLPTFLACLFFAFTDALQMQLQGRQIAGFAVPNQFVQIVPYVATLIVLVFFARKISAPAAINKDLEI